MLKTLLSGGLLCAAMVLAVQEGLNAGGNNGTVCPNPGGPDVIVGDIRGTSNYSSVGGIEAFAFGTESCNIGDEVLWWYSGTNQKPVIGQSAYQLKDGRFEMLGQGWLKHGFYALSNNFCGCGCSGTDGTVLGVGCSDLYSSGLNGQQSNMGPKYEVNAYTGYYPYPPTDGNNTGDGIYKRVQISISDLDPSQDGGGVYFVEAQYVSPDDSAVGNGFNNASWIYANVSGSGSSWSMEINSETTVREEQVLYAWAALDSDVVLTEVNITGEGLVLLGSRVYDLGGGLYEYEYAVQNYNSDRSIGSFTVPITPGAQVSEIGFHDVDYHSGSPIDGIDWEGTTGSGYVTWECPETYEENEWANAIRWGTTYNFRFRANVTPQKGDAVLGLFKPPSGHSTTLEELGNAVIPTGDVQFVDCNENGVADDEDIADGTSIDCNTNGIPDECEEFDECPPELELAFVGVVPPVLSPSGQHVSMHITEINGGQLDPASPMLVYTQDGNSHQVSMSHIGGTEWQGEFGELSCGPEVTWYLQASSQTGEDYYPEAGAPPGWTSAVGDVVVTFEDNGEVDLGWTVSGDASDGQWTVADVPVGGGDRGDPPTDCDGSGACHLTDNVDGNSDVDNGSTILTSPTLDASIYSPILSYCRWFDNSFGASPYEDTFDVEISDDDGATWMLLEQVGPAGDEVSGGWYSVEFALNNVPGFTPNADFRIRFTANDLGSGSVVEAGVDAISISSVECESGDCPGDTNGDTVIDVSDLLNVIADWNCTGSCQGDVNGDEAVDVADLLLVIASWGTCDG